MHRFAAETFLFSLSDEENIFESSSDSDNFECHCDNDDNSDISSDHYIILDNVNQNESNQKRKIVTDSSLDKGEEPVSKKNKSEMTRDDSKIYNLKRASSNEDTETKTTKKIKIEGYIETEVPKLSNYEFIRQFRMPRHTYEHLVEIINDHLVNSLKPMYPEKATLIILYYLGSDDTYQMISTKFQVTVSSIIEIIKTGIGVLCSLQDKYVKFPSSENYDLISNGLYSLTEIKDAIGVLGVSQCRIRKNDINLYKNKKGFHSVALQAVVDHSKKFLNIHVAPGSFSNVQILSQSTLNDINLNGKFLLGNLSYPALYWLVPPFRNESDLPAEQRLFNEQVHAGISLVREAFCALKGRFKRLAKLTNEDPETVENLLKACCVLHNICLDNLEEESEVMLDVDYGFVASECSESDEDDDKRFEVFSACMNPEQQETTEFLYEEYLPDEDDE